VNQLFVLFFRTILLSEHSDLVIITGASALFYGIGGPGKVEICFSHLGFINVYQAETWYYSPICQASFWLEGFLTLMVFAIYW
jgi:hypothetical protein